MKVYTIGRENTCDIVMSDNTDVISRKHAILNVYASGKMTITDQSQNGTYVNGMRITPNTAVPVTRKDNVSLAHVATLDWNRVPKQVTILQYIIIAVIAIIVIGGGIWGYNFFGGGGEDPEDIRSVEQMKLELKDSLSREKTKNDSILKAKNDSLDRLKAQNDSIQNANNNKPKPGPVPNDTTKIDTTKNDTAATRIR